MQGELTLFLGSEELLRKTSLVDMIAFDINSIMHCDNPDF
jgi:hypothetical protein